MFLLIFLFVINFSVAIDEKYDIMAKTCYGEDAFTSVTINASYLRVNIGYSSTESTIWTILYGCIACIRYNLRCQKPTFV